MNNGGIALRLVNCAKVIGGRMPGALAQSNVIANMLFGAISGSGAAAAAAIGSTMGPLEEAEGYDKNYSAAVKRCISTCWYADPPKQHYDRLFYGCRKCIYFRTVYGWLCSWSHLGLRRYHPGNHHSKEIRLQRRSKADSQHCIKDFLAGDPKPFNDRYCNRRYSLRCIYRNRRSAVAVVYATVLSLIYGSIKIKDIPRIVLESAKITGTITFMIGLSSIMSWAMAFTIGYGSCSCSWYYKQ